VIVKVLVKHNYVCNEDDYMLYISRYKNMYSIKIFNAQLGVARRMSLRIAFCQKIIL